MKTCLTGRLLSTLIPELARKECHLRVYAAESGWRQYAGSGSCDDNHARPPLECLAVTPRLIVSDNRDDPGNSLVLDGAAIDAAASDPVAIGKLMVDQVWAEGSDPTGGGLYYERNSNRHRRLQAFETGSEDFMTGGWVRVLASAEQVRKERAGMEQAASRELVSIRSSHRGVLLVEFLDMAWN
jgi:hypothetical protein